MKLHDEQRKVILSDARFKIVRAGRRSGKTALEVEDMSFTSVKEADSPIFYIAPTQTQARAIIWEALKSRLFGVGKFNESRLEVKVPTKDKGFSVITVAGWENRENFRGKKAKKIYFDEVDTMKDFFVGWQEIFRPALVDMEGDAMFSGTPKKENPNLRRLEKMAETDPDFEAFHWGTDKNPHISPMEIKKAKEELDHETYRQEIEAEYIDNAGSLFKYEALVDMFSNTVDRTTDKYLIVDIADDGSDKTIFSFWEGLHEYKRIQFERLNTDGIISKTREYCAQDKIPYSHVAVDAIGVGAGVASSALLDGIIGFKSSYAPIKTDLNIVRLPNVSYTQSIPLVSDYRNLRSQCLFTLADLVNNHKIGSDADARQKEYVIEELAIYQDNSRGDGKRMATPKEKVKEILGRSPDNSDVFIMRMYFVIMGRMVPEQSEERNKVVRSQRERMQARTIQAKTKSNK